MKLLLNFLTIIIILPINAFTQPILTDTELTPNIGDFFLINYCDSVNEGPAGINQIWNFTTNSCSGQFGMNITSSIGTSLPSSSFVQVVGTDSGFFNNSIAGVELIANTSASTGHINLNDTFKQINYPITYGSTMSDSFRYNPYNILSNTHYKFGRIEYIVDGYGTIILPSGTYTDVLRIKSTLVKIDSISGNSIIDSTLSFSWIKANNHNAIAWISKKYSVGATTPYPANFYYIDKIITKQNEVDYHFNHKIKLYPSPASDNFTIQIPKYFEIKEIMMFDYFGNKIQINIQKKSNQTYLISPKWNYSGIYIVKIIDVKNNIKIEKIEFEK